MPERLRRGAGIGLIGTPAHSLACPVSCRCWCQNSFNISPQVFRRDQFLLTTATSGNTGLTQTRVCQDTRQEVLIEESLVPTTLDTRMPRSVRIVA